MRRKLKEHDRATRRFYLLMSEAFTDHEKIEESEDGYTLVYPAGEPWARRLSQLRDELRKRFPAVEIDVAPDERGERLRLHVGGTTAAKQFVAQLIFGAQSGALKLPSPLRVNVIRRYRRATSPLRTLPRFLVIGAPRCGTTSLYGYLTQHPHVLPALTKEIGFFDIFFDRGPAWYRSCFPLAVRRTAPGLRRGAFVTGEATPTYLLHPRVPERVRQMLPNVKLIAMLRNPVDRAFSHYHFSVRNGFESLSFEDALDAEPDRLEGELEKIAADEHYCSAARVYHSYASTGMYADQLEAWTAVFPREQLLVVGMEAFARDPAQQFARVLEFLDLPAFRPAKFETMNAFPYPDLSADTRQRLAEQFHPHNERLWSLLGTDFGWDRAHHAVVAEQG